LILAPRTSLWADLKAAFGLATPFFRGRSALIAWPLAISVIACQLGLVAVAVRTNVWRNDFFQALQDRSWDRFVAQFWVYAAIGVALIGLTVGQQYLTQWLVIRWRGFLTGRLLDGWLRPGGPVAHPPTENPDQRVAEDTKLFAVQIVGLTTGFVGSVASLGSFAVILWGLSANVPLLILGTRLDVPGYLLWAAVLYAALGTWLTHVIGRALIGLNFAQEKREADFRYALVHVRDNREAIALARGEAAEGRTLAARFSSIVENWFRLITRTATLGIFTGGYRHYALFFPYLVMSPLYFAGGMAFGALMQAGSAFNEVRSALSYFVTAYPRIAELAAATERLGGFERQVLNDEEIVPGLRGRGGPLLDLSDVRISNADGRIIAAMDRLSLSAGDRVLVVGPSGSGKTSLAKAIFGMTHGFEGQIVVRAVKPVMLGEKPYLPLGDLKSVLAYPDSPEMVSDDDFNRAISLVGLNTLSRDPDWRRNASTGERQRLALTRVLLAKPDLVVLDEATAGLDEFTEREALNLISSELPMSAILSFATSSRTEMLHGKSVRLISGWISGETV
jgi:putative ATP-binding cassette transporter